jgi:hypothetical protein
MKVSFNNQPKVNFQAKFVCTPEAEKLIQKNIDDFAARCSHFVKEHFSVDTFNLKTFLEMFKLEIEKKTEKIGGTISFATKEGEQDAILTYTEPGGNCISEFPKPHNSNAKVDAYFIFPQINSFADFVIANLSDMTRESYLPERNPFNNLYNQINGK